VLRLTVGDEFMQDAPAARMASPVAAVVPFPSRLMTPEPGDITSTGSPRGVDEARGRSRSWET
jgi:2-keto-4-pentenoate hydratase/2-oxohepta-3-ene-1,7-dioic acid hydratase in catechol pathway